MRSKFRVSSMMARNIFCIGMTIFGLRTFDSMLAIIWDSLSESFMFIPASILMSPIAPA